MHCECILDFHIYGRFLEKLYLKRNVMTLRLFIFFLLAFCCHITFGQVQMAYNPFTQNIHYAPEPSVIGFECGNTPQLLFTMGMTTQNNATNYSNQPLVVHVLIEGFSFKNTVPTWIQGAYSGFFDWHVNPQNSKELIGIQQDTLPGTGTDPLNPNPLSSGEIAVALEVPASVSGSNILGATVWMDIPLYMSAFNSVADDDEASQTQFSCGSTACSVPPQIRSLPGNSFCLNDHVVLVAEGVPGSVLTWSYPSSSVFSESSNGTTSSLDLGLIQTSHSGWYIVTQNVPGCNQILSDSIYVNVMPTPVVQNVTTTCVNNQGQIQVQASGANLVYSLNGMAYQNSSTLVTSPGVSFQLAIRELSSNCVVYYSGACVNCSTTNFCQAIRPDSTKVPSLACFNQTIPLIVFSDSTFVGNWSTSGDGQFSNATCNTYPCTTYYEAGALDRLRGSTVFFFTGIDPDGSGPCQAIQYTKNVQWIEELLPAMIQGDTSVCVGEALIFEAKGIPALHQWMTPSGNYTAGSTFQKMAMPPDDGSWIHIQSATGCTTVYDTFQVEVLAQPNLLVNAQVLPEFCSGQGNGSIQLNIQGGSGHYKSWYNQNLGTSKSGTPLLFNYLAPGNYSVSVHDSSCASHQQNFSYFVDSGRYVHAPYLSLNTTVCQGEPLSFNALADVGNSLLWTQSSSGLQWAGNPISLGNSTLFMTGNYQVKAIDSMGCGSIAVPFQVVVHPKPVISESVVTCAGVEANLFIHATIQQGQIEYSLNGGPYQNNPEFLNLNAGVYTISVRGIPGGCVTEELVHVKNCACQQAADIVVNHPLVACGQASIPLEANLLSSRTLIWNTSGSGNFSNTITIGGHSSTLYHPTASDILNGSILISAISPDPDGMGDCTSETKQIRIYLRDSIHSLQVIGQDTYCEGDTLMLESNLYPIPLTWWGPGFTDSMTATYLSKAKCTYLNSGWYSAALQGPGCSVHRDSIQLNILQRPNLQITENSIPETCEFQGNGQIEFKVQGGSGLYQSAMAGFPFQPWVDTSYRYRWLAAGTHKFYIADQSCPNAVDSVQVTLSSGYHVDPPTSIPGEISVCQGSTLSILSSGPAGEYQWSSSNGTNYTGNPLVVEDVDTGSNGIYTVKRIENGCASLGLGTTVKVFPNPEWVGLDTLCGEETSSIHLKATNAPGYMNEYRIHQGAWQTDPLFSGIGNGLYQAQIRTLGSSCVSEEISLELSCSCYCNREASAAVIPNPCSGAFHVRVELIEPEELLEWKLVSMQGQVVASGLLEPSGLLVDIPVTDIVLRPGTYSLNIHLQNSTLIRPVQIIQP